METKTIIAKAIKGQEFLYNPNTAHGVNPRKAHQIAKMLNDINWHILDCQVWHVLTVDRFDSAYEIANDHKFILGKTGLKEKNYR